MCKLSLTKSGQHGCWSIDRTAPPPPTRTRQSPKNVAGGSGRGQKRDHDGGGCAAAGGRVRAFAGRPFPYVKALTPNDSSCQRTTT